MQGNEETKGEREDSRSPEKSCSGLDPEGL